MKIPFISKLFEKRSTSGLSNPSQWFVDWLSGGKPSLSGVTVNETTALNNTAVFACVRILAETVASLPVITYKKLSNGGKERATKHPLYKILHDEPNTEMSAFTFYETLMGHLVTWGNAYAEIEWDDMGRVTGLWPLSPSQTWIERAADGAIWYHTIRPRTNELVTLPAWRVLHVPGLGFDGIQGYSVIKMNREAIGLAIATEKYGASFFGNGARPGGVLEHPGKLSQEAQDRLRGSWNEMHQGLEKQHRVAILEEGLAYKQIGLPPEDSQFLETRKFQVTEIARMFRVPPHMLADLERATFSNIEHQSIEFVVHTIRPWLVRWEQEIRRKLLSQLEKRSFFVEFLVDGLLRGDIKSRSEALQIQRQNGIINADEWREIENMNPQEGEQGKKYLVNSAMIAVDQIGLTKGGEGDGQKQGNPINNDTGEPSGGKEK